jgi:hypothetical protein
MIKKASGNYSKERKNSKEIDPKLWDRLIWQEAIDKAIKWKLDRCVAKQCHN